MICFSGQLVISNCVNLLAQLIFVVVLVIFCFENCSYTLVISESPALCGVGLIRHTGHTVRR